MTGWGLDAPDAQLWFGDQPATVLERRPSWARVQTPPGAPGLVDVRLEQAGAPLDVLADGFDYRQAIGLESLSPAQGPTEGGTEVTLRGPGVDQAQRVRFGGLAASIVERRADELVVQTPAHSAGPVDVVAERDGLEAALAQAFTYTEPLQVWGFEPTRGAIAGGTYVRVRGRGFTQVEAVSLGGVDAPVVRRQDRHTLYLRTPPGQPGEVGLQVRADGQQAQGPYSFQYFDPASRFGGASGGAVDGAVNVTVLDTSGGPIPGAFVMLSTRADTRYQGTTDRAGQVTLSGPGLAGEQVVTATAAGYSSVTLQRVDARNITVLLEQLYVVRQPPGEPPLFPDMGTAARDMGTPPMIDMSVPDMDMDDGESDPGEGMSGGGGGGMSGGGGNNGTSGGGGGMTNPPVPLPPPVFEGQLKGLNKLVVLGEDERLVARVYTTRANPYTLNPPPGPGSELTSDGAYRIQTRTGDLALVALGGVQDTVRGTFTPLIMGVVRYQFAARGEVYQRDILLDIPLDQTHPVKLSGAPTTPGGAPNINRLVFLMDFGFEGIFDRLPGAIGLEEVLELEGLPALSGQLQGVDLTLEGGAYTGAGTSCARGVGAPCSVSIGRDVVPPGGQIELPMLDVPTVTQPDPWQAPTDGVIRFTYDGPNPPDLFYVLVRDELGRRYWEAFLPGSARSVRLPEFPDFGASLPDWKHPVPYRSGDRTMFIIAIEQPGLSIHNFTYSDLSVEQWRAYSLLTRGIRL